MTKDIIREDDCIELGTASIETKGVGDQGIDDAGRQLLMGLSDD